MRNFKETGAQEIFNVIKNIPKIPELDFENSLEFIVSSEKEILNPLIEQNEVIVVAGAFFGDEGKGKTVAAIANHPDIKLIARVNSGENAGHTVYYDNKKYIFHLNPSGILTGKPNVIGPNCVMDPISFMEKEIKQLIKNGINYSNLSIGNVQIVMPYHKVLDSLRSKNSSTLKGMSPVHSSKVMKKGLRLDDLFNSIDKQKEIIKKDIKIFHALLNYGNLSKLDILNDYKATNNKSPGKIPEHIIDFLNAPNQIDYLIELYKKEVVENKEFPKRGDTTRMIQETLENKGKVLLEGPQSFFLSNNIETHWRSSTSADTTSAGIKAAAGYNQEKYKSVTINVHKVPTSRVGIGANPSGFVKQDFFSKRNIENLGNLKNACDDFDAIQKQFFNSIKDNGIIEPTIYKDDYWEYTIGAAMAIASSKKHKEFGATTLKPRVCGIFDCVAHHKVNKTQGPYLTISALDRLNQNDKVGLVIAYTVFNPNSEEKLESQGISYKNGDIIKPGDAMPCENVLKHCYPIIKVMGGWKGNPIETGKLKKGDELPKQVNQLLGNIIHYTGSKIISLGDGPETENLVYIKRK